MQDKRRATTWLVYGNERERQTDERNVVGWFKWVISFLLLVWFNFIFGFSVSFFFRHWIHRRHRFLLLLPRFVIAFWTKQKKRIKTKETRLHETQIIDRRLFFSIEHVSCVRSDSTLFFRFCPPSRFLFFSSLRFFFFSHFSSWRWEISSCHLFITFFHRFWTISSSPNRLPLNKSFVLFFVSSFALIQRRFSTKLNWKSFQHFATYR